jgi:ribosomal-protein-serine acetyltransferase
MFGLNIDDELALGLLELRHAEALFKLTDENRRHLRPWLPWVDSTTTVEDTRSFIRRGLKQFARGGGLQAGLWFHGEIVGCIGLHEIHPELRRTEFGYWLSEPFQGRGIVTRACRQLCSYAFDELGLHRVVIRCAPENLESRAIPDRLSFKQEGTLRAEGVTAKGFIDLVVYGLLAREWRARQEEQS